MANLDFSASQINTMLQNEDDQDAKISALESQQFKTINGESIKGSGNITIGEGSGSTPVVDSLDSDSTTSALSAKQGKVLNDKINKDGERLNITDASGKVAMRVDENGTTIINDLKVEGKVSGDGFGELDKSGKTLSADRLQIVDKFGKVAMRVNADGTFSFFEKKELKKSNLKSDVNMILQYGQSLSVRGVTDNANNGLVRYTPNVYGFANLDGVYCGLTIGDDFNADDAFGTSYKQISRGDKIHSLAHVALYYSELLINKYNYKESELPKFLLASCGVPGIGIDGLMKTASQGHYKRIIESVKQGMKIALSEGETFNVTALCWLQGENNVPYSDGYKDMLVTLFTDINNDVKAITGQDNDVIFCCYNMATKNGSDVDYWSKNSIPLQTFEAVCEHDNYIEGSAMYMYSYPDNLHSDDNYSYRIIGSTHALQLFDKIENGEKHTLAVKSCGVTAGTDGKYYIQVRFDVPCKPLRFVELGFNSHAYTNHGFKIVAAETPSADCSDDSIIESVVINNQGDGVIITCSQSPIGYVLTYAWGGGLLGGGDVCDSSSVNNPTLRCSVNYNFYVKEYEINNYVPIFKIQL